MRIYIGNLDFAVTSDELTELFAPFGKVKDARVMTDRITGQSRGFAFVEMLDSAEAMHAIEQLDRSPINGRPIRVNEARSR